MLRTLHSFVVMREEKLAAFVGQEFYKRLADITITKNKYKLHSDNIIWNFT